MQTPDANHPTTQKRQEEKRNLRKAQRINGAIERKKTYSEIMKASKEDSKLLYKLVNKQLCTTTHATSAISYNDENFNTPSQICDGFDHLT
jgi:hypothetical protein